MIFPEMRAALASTVPPGKFVIYSERDRNCLGFTIVSSTGSSSSDLILLPSKKSDPEGFWRYWSIEQVSDDSALVLEGVKIKVDPIQNTNNFKRNQLPSLGHVYLIDNKLALCAASPEPRIRVRGRMFDTSSGAEVANQDGGIVGFSEWKLMISAEGYGLSEFYDPNVS